MNKQNKELLLKELSARFPYKVKVQIKANNCYDGINTLNLDDLKSFIENSPRDEDWYDVVTSIKPYLRPMESMTKKEERKYSKYAHFGNTLGDWTKSIDYLYAHQIDFRGLIPLDLALPAPEGMYEVK